MRRALSAMVLIALGACGPSSAELETDLPADVAVRPDVRATGELENLQALAHLHGYVRFFHPTDAAAEADWEALVVAATARARRARTVGELAAVLEETYGPYAPTLQLWTGAQPSPEPRPGPRRLADRVYWQYQGFPGTPVTLYQPPYRRVRVGAGERSRRAFTQMPEGDARVQAEIVPDLNIRLPVVLSRDAAREADDVTSPADPPDPVDVRYAAVIEVWNVLRHFYPYQDAVAQDWDALLQDALLDARDDASTEDTVATLRRLVHRINDGHGEVGNDSMRRRATLPFRLELVDGEAVITGTSDPEEFEVGDVVVSIDSKPVLEAVRHWETEVSGSPQWRSFKATAWQVPSGPADRHAQVELVRDGTSLRRTARYVRSAPPPPRRPEPLHRYDDGVFYVDLTRAAWFEIQERMPEIAEAPGVVFDMRGYPNETHRVLEHLLAEPEDALWMHVPHYVEPGGEPIGWLDLGWHLRPAQPRITGDVTFLVSAEAISYAESVLGYVEAHDLGTVIGATPSAGTNGDIVRFDTVGDYYVVFTGMQVTRHDGRPFHLQGVAPQIIVDPTLEALQAGRDDQLEAALALLRDGARPLPG